MYITYSIYAGTSGFRYIQDKENYCKKGHNFVNANNFFCDEVGINYN